MAEVYVNFKGVPGVMILDIELVQRFRCQWSNCAQLITVVLPLVDKNVLTHIELIVGPFAVAKCLRPCLFVIQCTVDNIQIRSHFLNPVSDLDSFVTFQSDLVEIRKIEPEMMAVPEVQVEWDQLSVRNWCVVYGDLDHVQ